ncbi:MAG: hypothetical protein COB53_10680 [Elusimicrobia bacterium]|nr:MAG: hypothetical protein COB53_10680 [Elusimicrobiota bacterium]
MVTFARVTHKGPLLRIASVLAFVLSVGSIRANAAITQTLNYQGHLTDSSTGLPVDTFQDFQFALCNSEAASCATTLFDETRCNTPVQKGRYEVEIGSSTGGGIPAAVFADNAAVWLEIRIDTGNDCSGFEDVLSPRIRMQAAPYAFNAIYSSTAAVLGLEGGVAGAFAASDGKVGIGESNPNARLEVKPADVDAFALQISSQDGTAMMVVDKEGRVGIGTASPDRLLHLTGASFNESLRLGYWNAITDADIDGILPGSTFGSLIQGGDNSHIVVALKDNDNADSFAVVSGGGNYMTDTTYDQVVLYAKADGNVGIGDTNPLEKLSIRAAADTSTEILKIRSNSGIEKSLFALDSGGVPYLSFNTAGYVGTTGNANQLYLASTGNVGIGETAPAAKLEIKPVEADNYTLQVSSQNGTAVMVVDKAGNVGIGTTNPTGKLDVRGDIVQSATALTGFTTIVHRKSVAASVTTNLVTFDGTAWNNVNLEITLAYHDGLNRTNNVWQKATWTGYTDAVGDFALLAGLTNVFYRTSTGTGAVTATITGGNLIIGYNNLETNTGNVDIKVVVNYETNSNISHTKN